ncbi:hypothetical protein PQR29_00740 [Paraburkholderia strydomiana]|uniref:hypothetical protein n=1 Tax=Paraburkholderia strydomiana TaxID=1245417 RepID=UPI0038BD248D
MLNGFLAVRITTINFSGTRFGRKGPQQSGLCTSSNRHRTPGVARIWDVPALSHLPIGRPSSVFARELGASAASIAAKK